jgi:hypothetical protein
VLLLWLLLALVTAACGNMPAADSPPQVPTAATTPTGAPPVATSGPATATSRLQPAPTATVAAAQTIQPSPTPLACQFAYFFAPAPDACPAAGPTRSPAAEQPFENGVMIWLAANDSILVFYADGRWQRFEDTWSEGQPESDPTILPPEGRFQPIRGFGKVWRERPAVGEALGWAVGVELGFESTFQEQTALPERSPLTYLRTYNGQIYGLIERAPDQGEWVLAADNR